MRRLAIAAVLLAVGSPLLAADPPPRTVREEIEWLDVWVPGNSDKALPKVLLVGDSITRGYYGEVQEKLKGKAVVCRLTTSKSLGDAALVAEVNLVLSQTSFDVVHLNNGMHGWGYTEEEYAAALPELVAVVRKGAPKAKLVWASTTPVWAGKKPADRTERVKARNEAAAKLMAAEKIAVDDLFAAVADRPEWFSGDGVHLNAKGTTALAEKVAGAVGPLLK